MDEKDVKLLSKDDKIKLKDLIFDYLDISFTDLNNINSIKNPELFNLVSKYQRMLINIKNVCVNRNKF